VVGNCVPDYIDCAGQFENPTTITGADHMTFLENNFGQLASSVNKIYPVALFNSTPYPAYYAISAVITDAAYFCPARCALKATIKVGKPVWTYRSANSLTCGWEPNIGGIALELLGPTHSSEIPLVFSQLTQLPLPNGTCSLDAQEVEISKALVSAWTSMATAGNPGAGAGILGGPWPQYNANESNGLLVSNVSSVGYVNYTVCDFWDKIAAAEANLTTNATSSIGQSGATSSAAPATFTGGSAKLWRAVGTGLLTLLVVVISVLTL
jgi:Carboxylesterase family